MNLQFAKCIFFLAGYISNFHSLFFVHFKMFMESAEDYENFYKLDDGSTENKEPGFKYKNMQP